MFVQSEAQAPIRDECRTAVELHGEAMQRQFVEDFELSVTGDDLLHTLKRLLRDDSVRRIVFRNDQGRSLIEIPSTLGLEGTALAPVLAAVGALAALEDSFSVIVEKASIDHEAV
jgi:hypothetical protein